MGPLINPLLSVQKGGGGFLICNSAQLTAGNAGLLMACDTLTYNTMLFIGKSAICKLRLKFSKVFKYISNLVLARNAICYNITTASN